MTFNNKIIDQILDENLSPVARMRLFSGGIKNNNRVIAYEHIIGDRACLACGNCVDNCPVVRDNYGTISLQNQRTSMALEHLVGEECRRCYGCIKACPQVEMDIKEYSSAHRRGEKAIHFLFACLIVALALSGITGLHYGDILPKSDLNILRYIHRGLGVLLVLVPVLYLLIDKGHLIRIFDNIFLFDKRDVTWIKNLIYHVGNHRKYQCPVRKEFNPAQKSWYLFIIGMIPIMSGSGLLLWILVNQPLDPLYVTTKLYHISFALLADILIFIHIYIKYLRTWTIASFDMLKEFIEKRTGGRLYALPPRRIKPE